MAQGWGRKLDQRNRAVPPLVLQGSQGCMEGREWSPMIPYVRQFGAAQHPSAFTSANPQLSDLASPITLGGPLISQSLTAPL